jgi:GT2 family glycosyltransferase
LIVLPAKSYDVVGSIVLFKTRRGEIEHAIEQFLSVPLRTHLCVIDNSPRRCVFSAYDPARVTYFFANRNLGYGRANNIALRAAAGRSPYSLVMNTDVTYEPRVVERLVEFLDAHPNAGLVGPKVRYPDGSLQHVCRLLPTPANMFLRRFAPRSKWTERSDARYELRSWNHDTVANIPYFQASYVMLRTDLCNQLGGFDERFFLYGEDIDLTRRIHEVADTLYIPDVHVTHEYRRYSNSSLRGTWYGIQNNCRYFNKWGWFFDSGRRRINRMVLAALHAHAHSSQAPSNTTAGTIADGHPNRESDRAARAASE